MSKEQVTLQGEARSDLGKGASRRLRRLHGQVPAIIYGGKSAPISISLHHNKIIRALEEESFYSSLFTINLGDQKEQVILKDLQRHPYKQQILHMDLQRVSAKETITKMVPLHFINEEQAKGVKAGGLVSRITTEVEVRCFAKDLPSHIEIDLADTELDQTLHLSNVSLPKGVELTVDLSDSTHDQPVLSIHTPKRAEEDSTEAVPAADSSGSKGGDSAE